MFRKINVSENQDDSRPDIISLESRYRNDLSVIKLSNPETNEPTFFQIFNVVREGSDYFCDIENLKTGSITRRNPFHKVERYLERRFTELNPMRWPEGGKSKDVDPEQTKRNVKRKSGIKNSERDRRLL